MKVFVLIYHDVWDVTDAERGNPNGVPEEASVSGVFASHAAAEAAQVDIYDRESEFFRDNDYYTIEEFVISDIAETLAMVDRSAGRRRRPRGEPA